MRKIGDSIDKLIHTNVELWHEADGIKHKGKPIHDKPTAERVAIFRRVRVLNARRSAVRWEIDSTMGTGSNETKVNYCEDEK